MHGLPRLDWIYRFNSNHDYPNPVEEIGFISKLDVNERPTYLVLAIVIFGLESMLMILDASCDIDDYLQVVTKSFTNVSQRWNASPIISGATMIF
jgi:hypothetical protein